MKNRWWEIKKEDHILLSTFPIRLNTGPTAKICIVCDSMLRYFRLAFSNVSFLFFILPVLTTSRKTLTHPRFLLWAKSGKLGTFQTAIFYFYFYDSSTSYTLQINLFTKNKESPLLLYLSILGYYISALLHFLLSHYFECGTLNHAKCRLPLMTAI